MTNRPAFNSNILLFAFTPLLSSRLHDGTNSMQLASFFSPSTAVFTSEEFSCPSLYLRGHISGLEPLVDNISLIEIASMKFSLPIEVDRSTLHSVPQRLLRNVMFSFNRLLSSRLRHSNSVLLKNAIKAADQLVIKTLENLLIQRKPIKICNFAVSFRVQDVQNGGNMNFISNSSSLPLIFEVKVDLNILGIEHKIHLTSRGTISCNSDPQTYLFQSVHVVFDTAQFLRAMIDSVKLTVKKTLRRAANITALYVLLKCNQDREKKQYLLHPDLIQVHTFNNRNLPTNYPERVTGELKSQLESYPMNLASTIIELSSYPWYANEAENDTNVFHSPIVQSSPEATLQSPLQGSTSRQDDIINACISDEKKRSPESSQHHDSPARKKVCWTQEVQTISNRII